MKKKLLAILKVFGIIAFYALILVASIFLTMSILIKGEEIKAPDLIDKNLTQAYEIASRKGVYLKKIVGNYDKNYKPLTVINQSPSPGVSIKEKSFIKVFITSEIVEVIVPDLSGYSLREGEKILRENDLKKRFVSYIDADNIPVDFVIAQSLPPGVRVPRNSEIDILVSKGKRNKSYIMPDIIGKKAEKVLYFFERKKLKISKITTVPYPGLESGIIIKQFPSSGFRINLKNLIGIQVSE